MSLDMLVHKQGLRLCELLLEHAVDLPVVGEWNEIESRLILDGKQPDGFDMSHVYVRHKCGTSACVLGWSNWFGSQGENLKSIDFDYDWCYDSRWAAIGGVKAAVHRMYYELAYGPPAFRFVTGAFRDWASFVEKYPFQGCKERAYAKS